MDICKLCPQSICSKKNITMCIIQECHILKIKFINNDSFGTCTENGIQITRNKSNGTPYCHLLGQSSKEIALVQRSIPPFFTVYNITRADNLLPDSLRCKVSVRTYRLTVTPVSRSSASCTLQVMILCAPTVDHHVFYSLN